MYKKTGITIPLLRENGKNKKRKKGKMHPYEGQSINTTRTHTWLKAFSSIVD